jgi:hypothetical protein
MTPKTELPEDIEQFLTDNPDYEAIADAKRIPGEERAFLIEQMQTGALHPFMIHDSEREAWAVFVELDEIGQFLADYPNAIACTFDGAGTLEPKREH